MEMEEFKNIMNEYVKEISDPKNQSEFETYLRQLEEQQRANTANDKVRL